VQELLGEKEDLEAVKSSDASLKVSLIQRVNEVEQALTTKNTEILVKSQRLQELEQFEQVENKKREEEQAEMKAFKKEISRRVKDLKKEHKDLREQNKKYKKVLTAMGVYIDRLQGNAPTSASIAAPTHLSASATGESLGSSEHTAAARPTERSGSSTNVRAYFLQSQGTASNEGAVDVSGSFLSTADLDDQPAHGKRAERIGLYEGQDLHQAQVKVQYSQSIIEGGPHNPSLIASDSRTDMVSGPGNATDLPPTARFSKTILERGEDKDL